MGKSAKLKALRKKFNINSKTEMKYDQVLQEKVVYVPIQQKDGTYAMEARIKKTHRTENETKREYKKYKKMLNNGELEF